MPPFPPPQPTAGAKTFSDNLSPRLLTWMAVGLALLGLTWRVLRYALRFPYWGDEVMLAMNFVWFDYGQLTQRLEHCQIAPLLFLWGERTALCWLGTGELALRLLPFLAGVAALGLYWRLTGLLLDPLGRLFAVGFLAVAIWPVSMGTVVKPYSFDLMLALVLMVPAVHYLLAPGQTRWLILLTLLAPVALLGSYPAVFVAGAVSLALARRVWHQGWTARCWFVAYNLALLAAFALAVHIGTNHLRTPVRDQSTQIGMTNYWADAFPPTTPLAFVRWFALSTTGQMAAYPVGSANGGSTLTVVLCLVGAACWLRPGRRSWLLLLAAPLLLNLAAAALHRYPYGASGRLSQHLAPGFCILAGVGCAALIERTVRQPGRRLRWAVVGASLFALIGLGGLIKDIVRPYHDQGCAWMRATMADIRQQVPARDPVVVCGTPLGVEVVYAWYWLTDGDRVSWDWKPSAAALAGERVWGFYHGNGADAACRRLHGELLRHSPEWRLVKRIPYAYRSPDPTEPLQQCELFCFDRSRPSRPSVTVAESSE
jgi:hypothetical protein